MNIDLLTKLVRLANNNPNDNEANLAARRACKLIEEGKFDFGVNTSKPNTKSQSTVRPQPQYENPFDMFTRYARAQQAYTQYNPYTEPASKCKNCGAELKQQWVLTEVYCEKCKVKRAEEQSKQHQTYSGFDWSKIRMDFDFETNPKPKPNPSENVTVKCLFCKQDFKRKTFTIDFICHQCYIKKNKSEKPPYKDDRTKTYYKSVFCYSCGHGFTVTYTEYEKEMNGQVTGNCEKCKASYIRATK